MNYCLLKDVWGNDFGCEIINEKYSIYDKSNLQLEETQRKNRQHTDELKKIKEQTLKTQQEQFKISQQQTKTAEEQKIKQQKLIQKELELKNIQEKLTKKQKKIYKQNKQILTQKNALERKLKAYVEQLFEKQNRKTHTSKITGGQNTLINILQNSQPIDILKYLCFIYLFCIFIKKYF